MSYRHEKVKLDADLNRGKEAIANDDIVVLENIIDKANERCKTNSTTLINRLLYWACNKGSFKCAKLLLDRGADINCGIYEFTANGNRLTPLLVACLAGSVEIVDLLIERGVVLYDYMIYLCLSCIGCRNRNIYDKDYSAVASSLIARIDNLNSHNFLSIVCGIASIEIVRSLLQRGSGGADYALEAAARRGDLDIVRLLLAWNHQVPISIDWVNRAFIAAATAGALDVVKVLAEYGANAYTTALSVLASGDEPSVEVAAYLLDHGADFHALDNRGRPIWQGLCESCIYPDYHYNRNLPVQYQSVSLFLPLAELYLERGADADVVLARSGNTALLACCSSRGDAYNEFATLLLEHGANVNLALPSTGETPLMKAALAARTKLVRLFLENGADVMQVNAAGQTVLDLMGSRPKYAKAVALCTDQLHNKPILK